MKHDTIVAIATPPGAGGVGIIRLSGPQSKPILEALSDNAPNQSHRLTHGHIHDPVSRETLDDVLMVWMKAPKSYTGEEVVEIHAHGNILVLNQIVDLCLKQGARLAKPGEFTQRAYVSGKLDLIQAEAVAELIMAESIEEARTARRRLSGRLSGDIDRLYQDTLSVLAECEADIDFPDENLPVESRLKLLEKIGDIRMRAEMLIKSHETNRKLQQGFQVAIIGAPNVGKSSLFNRLLEEDRAIVSSIPGTTRDVLREELIIKGRRVRLIDTAGMRPSPADVLESEGIERAKRTIEEVDLLCLTVSSDQGLTKEDYDLIESIPKQKLWLIWNKIDLMVPLLTEDILHAYRSFKISAKTGEGLSEFRHALETEVESQTPSMESGGISNDRQKVLLAQFVQTFVNAETLWRKGESAEFAAFELRQCLGYLGEILGKTDHQERILDEIFSRFCIGK